MTAMTKTLKKVWRKVKWWFTPKRMKKTRQVLINQKSSGCSQHVKMKHVYGWKDREGIVIDVSKVSDKDFLFVQISNDGINWTTIGDKFKVPEKRRYKGLNFEYIRAVKMNGAAWATMTVYG